MSLLNGRLGRIATVTSLSGDNVTNWLVLYGAELLSMTSFISNSYGFPPTVSIFKSCFTGNLRDVAQTAFYDAMDRGLWDLADGVNGSGIDNVTITELYGRAILTLFEPVFGSCMYIFTDLGAFLITLAALTLLQRNIDSELLLLLLLPLAYITTCYSNLAKIVRLLAYPSGCGIACDDMSKVSLFICVRLEPAQPFNYLSIGPPPNIQELFGEVEGGYAYIYALIGEWWLVAVVFASLLTVNIVDVVSNW